MGPQELANSAWACAKLAYLDEALLSSIAKHCHQRMKHFIPQDFANVAWAFSKLVYVNLPVLGALCGMSLTCISEFNCQDLANTAWAVANLLLRNEKLIGAIADQAEERRESPKYTNRANLTEQLYNIV